MEAIEKLYNLIKDRAHNGDESSYTHQIFQKGLGKIAKKYGEEAIEVVIAAMSESDSRLVSEIVDNLYHLLCLCAIKQIPLSDLSSEIERRIGHSKLSPDESYT